MQSGDLRERVGFYERVTTSDVFGNNEAGHAEVPSFVVSANIKPRLGGESVLAGRLQGQNLVNITVRYSSDSERITTDWLAKNERSGVVYNIRSIVNPDQKRKFIELLAEIGVAV